MIVTARLAAVLVAGLLVAEFLLIAILFSTQPLFELDATWWGSLLSRAYMVPHLAVAIATGAAIFGARRVTSTYQAVRAVPRGRRWPYLIAHAIAFGLFFLTTDQVLGNRAGPDKPRWILPWLATGLLTVVTAMPAAIGRPKLLVIIKRTWPVLAAGAAVGIGAWLVGRFSEEQLWAPLRRGTMVGAHRLLLLVRPDALIDVDQFLLGVGRFSVTIDPVCSGYEGMGLAAVLLGGFLIAFRGTLRFPQALVILPIGVGVVWLGNVVRVAALVLVGTVSPEVAIGGFHSHAGSLLFCALTLGLVAAARRWRFVSVPAPRPGTDLPEIAEAAPPGGGAEPYLIPFLAVLAVALVTGALLGGAVDWFYPLRVAAAGVALWRYRAEYRALFREGSWIGVPVGVVVFGLWLALVNPQPDRDAALAAQLRAVGPVAAGAWMVARALGAMVMAPLVEELAFRAYLFRRLGAADFRASPYPRRVGLPLVASSLLFGLIHGEVLAGALAGAAYALAAARRGFLRDAVIAHATTNLLLVIWGSASGHWGLWM